MGKKFLIQLMHKACNSPIQNEYFSTAPENALLILVTAAGEITGNIIDEQATSKSEDFFVDTFIHSIGEAYTEKTHNNDFVLLKNATLKTSSGDISYGHLYVFTDDIIAATVSNSDVK